MRSCRHTAVSGLFSGLVGKLGTAASHGKQLLDASKKLLGGHLGGALQALSEARIALAEDHMRVWSPATGQKLAGGPVITWASRTRARLLSSLAVAALSRACFARSRYRCSIAMQSSLWL